MLFRSRRTSLLLLSSIFLAAGCGGGDDTDGANTGSTTTTTLSSATTSTAATVTTTSSTTTTTRDATIPPFSSTVDVLSRYPDQQALGNVYDSWGVSRHWTGIKSDTIGEADGRPIGNVQCNDYQDYSFGQKAHAHLAIYRNGERLLIPDSIGHTQYCLYGVNTDIRNGVIDAYAKYKPTFLSLGDFFRIWNQPLSRDNIGGITGLPVVIYINDKGNVTEYTGDPTKIELIHHRSIVIQIGSPIKELPNNDWRNYP